MALSSVPPMSGVGRFVPPPSGFPVFSEIAASCPGQLLADCRSTSGSNKHWDFKSLKLTLKVENLNTFKFLTWLVVCDCIQSISKTWGLDLIKTLCIECEMWATPRHLKLKTVAFCTLACPLPVIQTSTEAFTFSDEVHILRLLLLCLPQNAPSIFRKAIILMSKLSCCYCHVNTGGVCPLAFPETAVVWLPYSQNTVTVWEQSWRRRPLPLIHGQLQCGNWSLLPVFHHPLNHCTMFSSEEEGNERGICFPASIGMF